MIKTSAIPVFIVSRNRFDCLKKLICWLEKVGLNNIHIIDNASTYQPLVDYLDSLPYNIHKLPQNYGHLVLWKSGQFEEIINNEYFILTDPDVIPVDECPADVIEQFYQILQEYPGVTKVGFSLKIDDLPDFYPSKQTVCEWERRFWSPKICKEKFDIYKTIIDTTFALYRPGIRPNDSNWFRAIRTGIPYTARHLSWYLNPNDLDDEEIFYKKTVSKESCFWALHTDDTEIRKKLNL